ncbi:glycosyltransferase family 2 protein [Polaribacter sp.]|uniref:glycosyltransferase family 2 protein n=1 Tax=Polaribacter sp. TaxID=1920175 RepID=UPI003EF4FD59
MNSSNLVSILIPTYNRRDLVVRAIDSALNQTYKNIEIIVSDNCSSDDTVKHLKKLYINKEQVKIFESSTNTGPVSNWVNCIKKSSGDYLKLLFSDDTLHENYIAETVKVLKENDNVGFVYTPIIIETNSKKRLFYRTYNFSKKVLSKKIENRFLLDINVPVSPGAALFRRKDLLSSIKYTIPNKKNLDFTVYGAGIDLNIYFEIIKKYKYVYFLDSTKAFFYGHNTSFTINNNLDYYYKTVRMNFLQNKKPSFKKLYISILINLKFTKIFNYFSPYFN